MTDRLLDVGAAIGASALGVLGMGWSIAAESAPSDLGPWISGGGAAAAVGGLVYIAKKLAAGELVSYRVDEQMKRSEKREEKLEQLLEDSREREDAFRAWLAGRGMH